MGFRLMGLVVIPAAAILFVLARPIVNALLDYGSFSSQNGAATAETLAAFAVGLFSFSAYLFTLRGFYAMQDTRTPFLLNALENGLNIAFAFALYPLFGVQGLALSWSIAYIVAMVVSLAAMRRRLGRLEGRRTADTLGRVLARDRGPRRAGLGRRNRDRLQHTGAGDRRHRGGAARRPGRLPRHAPGPPRGRAGPPPRRAPPTAAAAADDPV